MADWFRDALLRRGYPKDFADLADEHYKHDLQPEDREKLQRVAKTIPRYTIASSFIGAGLGIALAFRVRGIRAAHFRAFKAKEMPHSVVYGDGRTEKFIDLTPLLKPTTFGSIATYAFSTGFGVLIAGQTGTLLGTYFGTKAIREDPGTQQRISTAFRKFKADWMRKKADEMEKDDRPSFERDWGSGGL